MRRRLDVSNRHRDRGRLGFLARLDVVIAQKTRIIVRHRFDRVVLNLDDVFQT